MGQERDDILKQLQENASENKKAQSTPKSENPPTASNPDNLIICNSNGRGMDSNILQPESTEIHILERKTIQGASDFIDQNQSSPHKSIIFQVLDNDMSMRKEGDNIMKEMEDLVKKAKRKHPQIKIKIVEPMGRMKSSGHDYHYNKKAEYLITKLEDLVGEGNVIKCPEELKNPTEKYFLREKNKLVHLNEEGTRLLAISYRQAAKLSSPNRPSRRKQGDHQHQQLPPDFRRWNPRHSGSDSQSWVHQAPPVSRSSGSDHPPQGWAHHAPPDLSKWNPHRSGSDHPPHSRDTNSSPDQRKWDPRRLGPNHPQQQSWAPRHSGPNHPPQQSWNPRHSGPNHPPQQSLDPLTMLINALNLINK